MIPQIPSGVCNNIGLGSAYRFMAVWAASIVFFVCSQRVRSSLPDGGEVGGGGAQREIFSRGE